MVNGRGTSFCRLIMSLNVMVISIVLATGLVFGQGFSAAISGFVRDTTGAVIPGVTVTVKHIESGLTRTAVTSENGGYTIPLLPVGPYELTTDLPGFKQQVRRGINLVIGQEAIVNLTLEVGGAAEHVTVIEEAPLVNTTLSSTSGLINEGQIKDMPLNGRSFEQLLTLNTGTVNNNAHSGGSSFSVGGKRTETNRFTMNGVDYVGDNATGQYIAPQGASQQLLGVDAVREYNVLGYTYGAEYGKRAGGQITVVTTSGTNQWHGAAFEYLRNSAFDARNFFDRNDLDGDGKADAAPFKRNQFGGSLGGPIIKDKMFVFGNYEGFRERLAVTSVAIVPNLQARLGRLPNASGQYVEVPNLQRGMLPFFAYWPEPNGAEILDTRGLPTGLAYLNSNPSRKVKEDFGLIRYDYNVSSKDSFSLNLTESQGLRNNPADDPIFRSNDRRVLYTLGLQNTHIFSPTILNTANFGVSHARGQNSNLPLQAFPDNLLMMTGAGKGAPGAFVFGGGATTNTPTSIVPPNGQNLHYNQRRNYTFSDDLRMTLGYHNLSMGAWFMRVRQTAFSSAQNNAGTASYNGLLEFLQDQPVQFLAAVNPQPLTFTSIEAAVYFQDEIKLRPNLTVRLGLRDEMTNGWNEVNNRASNYLFDANGILQTNPQIGRSPFVKNYAKALLQPRVGVAWDPSGKGTWSVRAAFGIHNDLQDNLAHRLNANQPFNARLLITGRPMLSIIPLAGSTAPPPTCSADSPLREPACAIYTVGGLDPNMHTPTIQQWTLEIERSITSDLAVQVGYVGHQSYHLSTSTDLNTIKPVICDNSAGCLSGGTRAARFRVTVPQGTEYIPVGARPNPFLGTTNTWMYMGTASYHAANISLTKRARNGLSFKTNYTWGKIMDISSAILGPSADNDTATLRNPYNPKLSRGIGSYSLKHQFNANSSYQLPFGNGRALGSGATGFVDKLIGNWQLNAIFNAQSGFPMTPVVGVNQSGNGDTRIPDVPLMNPNFKGNVILGVDGFKKTGRYFDPNAFLLPPTGTFGNVSRGRFTGPGFYNLDMSLFKRIPLKERLNLQFRAEAFNILNHANFNSPIAGNVVFDTSDPSKYAGTAGTITETANRERQIQFALRLEF
ncbi:MAG: TonB-dependent receptor [Acidobacteria bacterium]|nr:MAG: TonB-dependent receptor [Acidobacteriota bacterium]